MTSSQLKDLVSDFVYRSDDTTLDLRSNYKNGYTNFILINKVDGRYSVIKGKYTASEKVTVTQRLTVNIEGLQDFIRLQRIQYHLFNEITVKEVEMEPETVNMVDEDLPF